MRPETGRVTGERHGDAEERKRRQRNAQEPRRQFGFVPRREHQAVKRPAILEDQFHDLRDAARCGRGTIEVRHGRSDEWGLRRKRLRKCGGNCHRETPHRVGVNPFGGHVDSNGEGKQSEMKEELAADGADQAQPPGRINPLALRLQPAHHASEDVDHRDADAGKDDQIDAGARSPGGEWPS